jgi:bifunctional non-homologous end joining protein LigD
VILEMVRIRAWQRLGEKDLCPARDAGHRRVRARRQKWNGLYLGRRKGRDLIYAGKVDHGFDTALAKDLQARLKPLIRETQPYSKKIAHRGIWVEPSLLAEIEYRAKSAEGKVRHPFFKGVREEL